MSEPIRRRLIEVLASGEHTAGILTDVITFEFRVSRAAVNWHLAILRDNGWIDIREEYTSRFYRLEPDAIEKLTTAVKHLENLWERRIGFISKNDPKLEHVYPIDNGRPPRLPPGQAKGLRGYGRRSERWAMRPIPTTPLAGPEEY